MNNFPISMMDRYLSPQLYNWYYNGTVEEGDSLEEQSDGVATANGTSFTSALASFTSSMVNEYLQIEDHEGVYKITAVPDANTLTLHAGYRGASDTGLFYQVRPVGTPKIGYSDQEGDALTPSSSALVWYQRRPLPLYNDYDQILLPGSCKAIRVAVTQYFMIGKKYDNDALKRAPEYISAIAQMKPLNPIVGRNPRPRDRTGNVIRFGRVKPTIRTNQNNRRILGV